MGYPSTIPNVIYPAVLWGSLDPKDPIDGMGFLLPEFQVRRASRPVTPHRGLAPAPLTTVTQRVSPYPPGKPTRPLRVPSSSQELTGGKGQLAKPPIQTQSST